ncbi:MAG: OsmC family protein [Bacteroidetes bacterium]|nr:OsmC family protein [Bacteroidota bacterium]
METHRIACTWAGGQAFDSEINGSPIHLDGDHTRGQITPKKLMLVSLAGCTAIDVVSLLEKMRQELTAFEVAVEAPVTDEHPRTYTEMKIIYTLRGNNLDPEKVRKAVELSKEKYCGVSALLRKAVPLSFEIRIEPAGQ